MSKYLTRRLICRFIIVLVLAAAFLATSPKSARQTLRPNERDENYDPAFSQIPEPRN